MARTHQFAVAKRHGHWEIVETPELKQAKAEIQRLNEDLEQRVVARTRELAAANAELRREITERQRAEEALRAYPRRLIETQEAERQRIAREMHDEIGQVLTSISLMLTLSQQLPPDLAQTRLAEAQALVRDLIARVRNFALDLRPAMLDDLGLLPALLWLFERYTGQTSVQIEFVQVGLEGQRFDDEIETAAYRIVQEALTNVARHAGVRQVTVCAWANSDTLGVQIEDHGTGFDRRSIQHAGYSSGLVGMHERTNALGGQLSIDTAPGAGTRITAVLPLRRQVEGRVRGIHVKRDTS